MSIKTHEGNPLRQIVSDSELRRICRRSGDGIARPAEFSAGDEWSTGTAACRYCAKATRRSAHERDCPAH